MSKEQDWSKKGYQDILNKRISCVLSPEETFDSDISRMFRAVRFKVQLGFTMENELEQWMKTNAYTRFKALTAKKDDSDKIGKKNGTEARGGSHRIELYKMMTDKARFPEYIMQLFEYGLIFAQQSWDSISQPEKQKSSYSLTLQ